jgi:hypothetical protein
VPAVGTGARQAAADADPPDATPLPTPGAAPPSFTPASVTTDATPLLPPPVNGPVF